MNKGNNQVALFIPDLWKNPFPATFKQIIGEASYLSDLHKRILLELEELYITKEAIIRKGNNDLYHAHGMLSASTLSFTLNNWEKYWKPPESMDYLVLISAAILHDFGGFVVKETFYAEAINLLLSAELIVLLGRPTLDEIYKLFKYASYGQNSPVTWGKDLFSDKLEEVKIEKQINIAGLLLSYADIVAQLSSPSYHTRRIEMLSLLNHKIIDYIPIKLVVLADLIIFRLEQETTMRVPTYIKKQFKANVAPTLKKYDYKLRFESL